MDEYIKKNQALCCFSGWTDQFGDFHEPDEMIEYQRIEQLSAADVVPVRHGRWIRIYSRPGVFKYLGWNCDQCRQRTGNEYAPQYYKFCPCCGAKMDGTQ